MTAKEIEKLNAAGYTSEQVNTIINMLFLLADVQEQYLIEFLRMLKAANMHSFDMKQHIDRAINETRRLVRFVDRNCNYDYAEKFGDKADELKTLLDEWGVKS